MQDAGGFAVDLHHVVVAVAVERVAAIVGGDSHGNAACSHLVQQGHAAPARGAAGGTVLKVEIAHRQRHHGDARLRHEVEGAKRLLRFLGREAAAVAAQDAALEAVAKRRLGDAAQADGAGIVGFIDMEIDIQAVLRRQREKPVQRLVQRGGSCR